MRILYIAALLSMGILLGTAFFALRSIRRQHENKEVDLERKAWKKHQGAQASAKVHPASADHATSGAPAYTALLQGMMVGMAIVLLARAQKRMLKD